MKQSFDIDCTPKNPRSFLGLADVIEANDAIADVPATLAADVADETNPDKLMKQFAKAQAGKE
jgi:hypothetical protein